MGGEFWRNGSSGSLEVSACQEAVLKPRAPAPEGCCQPHASTPLTSPNETSPTCDCRASREATKLQLCEMYSDPRDSLWTRATLTLNEICLTTVSQ